MLGFVAVVVVALVGFGGWQLLTTASEARLCTLVGYSPPGGPFASAEEAFAAFWADDGAARAARFGRTGTTPAGPRPDVPGSTPADGPTMHDFQRRGDTWEWTVEPGHWVVLGMTERSDGWRVTGLNRCGRAG